jgi:hypothetical protein
MAKKQTQNEIDFLFELRVILSRYDVDIVATRDGMVQLQFSAPYGVYEFASITASDEGDDSEWKTEG